MTVSLPSAHTVIADVPEVKVFSSKFIYNFFEPDERINDTGATAPQFVKKRSSESLDSQFIESNKFNRFVPRYNRLDWKPVVELRSIIPRTVRISNNFSKIYNEQDFAVEQFIPIQLQDKNIDGKLNFAVKKLIEYQKDNNELDLNQTESQMDAAKKMMARLSTQISDTLIKESINKFDEEGYNFYLGKEKINESSLLNDISEVKQYMQLNAKFADIILASGHEAAFSLFDDEEKDINDQIKAVQSSLNISKNPNILDSKDYDFELLEYLNVRPIDTNGFEPRWQIIGYIIEKFELLKDGSRKQMAPIIIENANISTTVDYKIKYGARYQYNIKSVAYLESQAEDAETNDIVIVSYLISSKNSSSQIVVCEEQVPPPVPTDITTRWNYTNNELIVSWNFPPNTQRDIKQWQIFRRKTVDEAFELQKVYYFNDSVIKESDDYTESPYEENIEHMDNPKCFWVDKEFTKDSKYIYAVCSVDAHGHSSNYSIQLETSFNKYSNTIVKKLIAPSGCPKAYPNFNLYSDAFVDTIRDSGHSKLNVFFNPEYLKVTNSSGNDLNLLRTDKNHIYTLSIINIDLQEQTNIDIKLNDRRTTLKPHKQATEIKPTPKKFKLLRK